MSWEKDHRVLTSRELERIEFRLRTVLQEGGCQNKREASEICERVNNEFMSQLSPLGRRKLSQRLTQLMKKSSTKRKSKYVAMIEPSDETTGLKWESIDFRCISCHKRSTGQFLPVWPCGHKEMCENCAMKSYACMFCRAPIDHKKILSLRKNPMKIDQRDLLAKEAEKERKAANRVIRLQALKDHRKLVLNAKRQKDNHEKKLQNARVERERAEKAAFEEKARALRQGKALKREKAKRLSPNPSMSFW